MALQNFIDNSLPTIKAAWLNAVDIFVNSLFAGATTVAQVRDTLGVAAQPTYRNRVFNGRWQVAQFNNVITSTGYICDQWLGTSSQTTGFNAIRVASVGLADYPYFGRINSSTTNTIAAGSYWTLSQRIEGVTVDDINWGTSSAVQMTLSLWARVSVPGTYSIAIRNAANTRSYVTTFTSTDNQWHSYVFQIPGDSTGTYTMTSAPSATALLVDMTASCGTTYQTSILNTWQTGNFISANTQTQLMATNAATFDITGIQFERGAVATAFELVPYGVEIDRLMRYYEQVTLSYGGTATGGNGELFPIPERVAKRAVPGLTPIQIFTTLGVSNASFGYLGTGPMHIALTASGGYLYQITAALDARL